MGENEHAQGARVLLKNNPIVSDPKAERVYTAQLFHVPFAGER
jgi:hypothetical protein